MRYLLLAILILCPLLLCGQSLDIYGGRTDILCTATGNWHTQKVGNHWWVCTPLGHVFFKESLYITTPATNFNINAKYGNNVNYINAELDRFKAWGFNAIDTAANSALWPTSSPTPATLMPFVYKLFPSLRSGSASGTGGNAFSDNNGFAAINYVVQNIWSAMPDGFYSGLPYLPFQADLSDPGIAMDAAAQLQFNAPGGPNVNYLMEFNFDDADQEWGLRYGENNCPGPDGNRHQHLGWVSLASSPGMYAGNELPPNQAAHQYLSYNPTHVSKAGLETFLKNRYNNSISALNMAWGSSYTQFDSTGTTVTGETVATGDGRTTAYNYTLAHTSPNRYSVGVTVNGTLVAGDMAVFNVNGVVDPGRMWGPYVSGTSPVNNSGALSVTFSTTANQAEYGALTIRKISVANNVVTVQTGAQHGLWTGAKVNISGTTNYNGTALGPITVVDSITFTYALVSSFATETSGAFALNAVPGASDTIKVNYTYNGWGVGTGLMDEANNHSWSNGDNFACNLAVLPAQMQTDLSDYLYQIANTYYSGLKAAIHTYFPKSMYTGFDSLDVGHGIKTAVMKAAHNNLDAVATAYVTLTQAQLDTWYSTVGESAFYDSNYLTAAFDSPNPSSPSYYTTQDIKGQSYYSQLHADLNLKYTVSGNYPFIGMATWSYVDMNDGGGLRFGLVSPEDNAYDGHEDVSASVTCSAPLQAYTCGGESYATQLWQSTTAYGTFRYIVGLVSGTYYIFGTGTTGNGTTSGSQPNWTLTCPTLNSTCVDGTVTWKNAGVWTRAANPANMGNLITPSGGGILAGNALWLGINQSGFISSGFIGGTSKIGGQASIH